MYAVFIANCEHAALRRSRSVLDRYAQRIGDRAWATRITEDGLASAHAALRACASRNTSVACYRSDAIHGLRIAWIVGNRNAYDQEGRFAVATQHKESTPMPDFFRHAALMSQLEGYWHDIGKASVRFQTKLENDTGLADDPGRYVADGVRHEWISAWLFRHLESPEPEIQKPAASLEPHGEVMKSAWKIMAGSQQRISDPAILPMESGTNSVFDAVNWAIATHHRDLGGKIDGVQPMTGQYHLDKKSNNVRDCLQLSEKANCPTTAGAAGDAKRWADLSACSAKCMERLVRKSAEMSMDAHGDPGPLYWYGTMLMSRAALILADHAVSSKTDHGCENDKGILHANTRPLTKDEQAKDEQERAAQAKAVSGKKRPAPPPAPRRTLNQPLSWHLQSVGDRAPQVMRAITGDELPCLDDAVAGAVLGDRVGEGSPRYRWQNQATDHVSGMRGIVFNIASTGSGKTLANLKMALAMRHGQSVRLAVAFNLRSLTRQTAEAFSRHVRRIDASHPDTPDLRTKWERDSALLLGQHGSSAEVDAGPADTKEALDEDSYQTNEQIDVHGAEKLSMPSWLNTFFPNDPDLKLQKLICAPVLISTMDWIVASGEPGQQARHAHALIRVANSDLILDEVDSYDVKSSVAVMRVVKMAGMFGRNVIVSSATLNTVLAEGLLGAYARGRAIYDALRRGDREDWHVAIVGDHTIPDSADRKPLLIENHDVAPAAQHYKDTLLGIAMQFRDTENGGPSAAATKRYEVVDVDDMDSFYRTIADQCARLHDTHAIPPIKGMDGTTVHLSIGLVRVASVKECIAVSDHLLKDVDGRFIVTAYHARDIEQRRARKEDHLDRILCRHDEKWLGYLKKNSRNKYVQQTLGRVLPPEPGELEVDMISGGANVTKAIDLRLVVVATPVAEVGRDHDYDWAVIEPSSMHSIIQASGRVNRHRNQPVSHANIVILSHNAKFLEYRAKNWSETQPSFVMPGLETSRNGDAGKGIHLQLTHGSKNRRNSHNLQWLMQSVNRAQKLDADEKPDEEARASGVIDAGLVFDSPDDVGTRKTQFSACDDEATLQEIRETKKPLETDDTRIMCRDFREKFPLRDPNIIATYEIRRDEGSTAGSDLHLYRMNASQYVAQTEVLDRSKIAEHQDRQWLSFDFDCIAKLAGGGASSPASPTVTTHWDISGSFEILWNGVRYGDEKEWD